MVPPIFFINKWDPKSCRGWPLPPGLRLFCPCYSSTHMNARTQRFPTLHMTKAILFSFSGLIWLARVCICLFVQLFCAGKVSFILVCVEEISGASYLKEILWAYSDLYIFLKSCLFLLDSSLLGSYRPRTARVSPIIISVTVKYNESGILLVLQDISTTLFCSLLILQVRLAVQRALILVILWVSATDKYILFIFNIHCLYI